MLCVGALKDACSVKLVDRSAVVSAHGNIGNGVVGNLVYRLECFIGKGVGEDCHIARSCRIIVVIVFLVDYAVFHTVVNIALIPRVSVGESYLACCIKLMHTSGKLYCLGVGELVVGHIFCFCLTVDKTYLMCEEDISVVPVVCGNVTELVFYGDFGNLYFVGLFFLCLGGLFGDAEGVTCYKFDVGIEGNECIGLIALCYELGTCLVGTETDCLAPSTTMESLTGLKLVSHVTFIDSP